MSRVEDIAQEVSFIMPQIARTIVSKLSEPGDLPPAQMLALLAVEEKGPCHFSILSRDMHIAAPTTTGIIDRLENQGYVKRTQDEKDRRAVNVSLTRKGSHLAQKTRKIVRTRWQDMLSKLPIEDCEAYLRILIKIKSRL